jgi:uridine kinase
MEAMERPRSFSELTKELITRESNLLIAVDGPAGSGKTTFAKALSEHLPKSAVVHMDEIYNGWDDALTENLSSNLLKWVIEPFKEKKQIQYPVFDWHQGSYFQTKTLEELDFLILEGVGSGNKRVFSDLDYLIWIEADLELGLERVKLRDGEKVSQQMSNWRKQEEAWFKENQTKENAHIQVNGNPPIEIDLTKEFWPL